MHLKVCLCVLSFSDHKGAVKCSSFLVAIIAMSSGKLEEKHRGKEKKMLQYTCIEINMKYLPRQGGGGKKLQGGWDLPCSTHGLRTI